MRSHAKIVGHETMHIYVHMSGQKVEIIELMRNHSEKPISWLKRGVSLTDPFEKH